MLWNILSWCIFGLIVGGIARLLYPGDDKLGCLGTIVLGVIGSIFGGLLWGVLSGRDLNELHYGGFITSTIGGIIALAIFRRLAPPRRYD
jgi:uncharacterized membrane protein YeaQ/YmgE (transglycosylase-associated protein family)